MHVVSPRRLCLAHTFAGNGLILQRRSLFEIRGLFSPLAPLVALLLYLFGIKADLKMKVARCQCRKSAQLAALCNNCLFFSKGVLHCAKEGIWRELVLRIFICEKNFSNLACDVQ